MCSPYIGSQCLCSFYIVSLLCLHWHKGLWFLTLVVSVPLLWSICSLCFPLLFSDDQSTSPLLLRVPITTQWWSVYPLFGQWSVFFPCYSMISVPSLQLSGCQQAVPCFSMLSVPPLLLSVVNVPPVVAQCSQSAPLLLSKVNLSPLSAQWPMCPLAAQWCSVCPFLAALCGHFPPYCSV